MTRDELLERYRRIIPPRLQAMWDAEIAQGSRPQLAAMSICLLAETEWRDEMLDETDPDRYEFGICCVPLARQVLEEWLDEKLKEMK